MQIRGSVPLFWEQRSYQAEQHRISFTRRFHCTTPAFLKHFNDLIRRYGRILILDLLGQFYIFCVQIPFEVWFSPPICIFSSQSAWLFLSHKVSVPFTRTCNISFNDTFSFGRVDGDI